MHFVHILGVKGGDVLKIFEINKTEKDDFVPKVDPQTTSKGKNIHIFRYFSF